MAAVVVGSVNGYRRGFWLSLAQYVGLVVGVVLGAAAAGPLLDYIGIHNPVARPFGAVLVLVIGGSLGSSIGFAAGEPIRRNILRRGLHTMPDSIGGAALSTIAVLAMCWFLGLSFSRGPSQEIAQEIQRSTVLRTLDSLAPRPPAFLARVEGILSGVTFPPVFAGLEPSLPAPLPIPASVDTPGVQHAKQFVVKVTGTGCGGLVTGSGFPIGNGYMVTNAHVVSGTSNHRVETPGGVGMKAEVVYFDPDRDVALLYVPDYAGAALDLGPAERGTKGAVIGYPGGGPESVQPAVVDGAIEAAGRDIYNQKPVTRDPRDLCDLGEGQAGELGWPVGGPTGPRGGDCFRHLGQPARPGLCAHRRRDRARRPEGAQPAIADRHQPSPMRRVNPLPLQGEG